MEDGAMSGVRVESPEPGVALVVLDGPGRLNAMDAATVRALPGLLEQLAADPAVRAVALTGANDAFSAGGDLEMVGALHAMEAEELETLLRDCFQASVLLHEMAKPTIAAIGGSAAGGGLGLALACDLRIAGPAASFVSPFINMGLPPDYGVTWLLPKLGGLGFALEMALTGRRVRADEALAAGLVTRVCDDPLAEALRLAVRFAAQSPSAVAKTKQLMRESVTRGLAEAVAVEAAEQQVILRGSEFAQLWAAWQARISGGMG